MNCIVMGPHTAKRIIENLKYRLHHRLSKFDRSVFLNLKPIYGVCMAWFLSRILAGNLNSGHSYLITAAVPKSFRKQKDE